MKKEIPVYVESERGHDTEKIGEKEVKEKIEELVKKDMVVTVENKDGGTTIIPEKKSWENIFKTPTMENKSKSKSTTTSTKSTPRKEEPYLLDLKGIKSITATHKIRGG
jgi:hypothetical protein